MKILTQYYGLLTIVKSNQYLGDAIANFEDADGNNYDVCPTLAGHVLVAYPNND